ncbi:MAG: hypothetical protein EA392_07810 [Cryomorphaceae bacterium]|nr:MAG: hypothetical protein EA392_07810 [Cryomorphaceae bacterium]
MPKGDPERGKQQPNPATKVAGIFCFTTGSNCLGDCLKAIPKGGNNSQIQPQKWPGFFVSPQAQTAFGLW